MDRYSKLILILIAALLPAGLSSAAPCTALDYGEHATEAAALTEMQAELCDSTSDGTGLPRSGYFFYDTTLDVVKRWDGAAWETVDHKAGSLYVASSGGQHTTIAAGLAAATAGDTVYVSSEAYTEDISVPTQVKLRGLGTILNGEIIVADEARVEIYQQLVDDGDTGITLAGVGTNAWVDIKQQINSGTADGISVTDAASTLFYSGDLQVVSAGEGLSSASAGSVVYDLVLLAPDTGVGLSVSATGDAAGYIGICADNTGATCYEIQAGGGAFLTSQAVNADTAYTVGAGGELTLNVLEIDGIQTNAGTATVTPLRLGPDTLLVIGVNGNDTTPYPAGYATITAALAAASSGDVVMVQGDGTYTEDLTVPDGVYLEAPYATVIGAIVLGDDSTIRLHGLEVGAGVIGLSLSGANAHGYAELDRTTCTGTGIGAVNLTSTAHLHVHSHDLYVENGFGLGSAAVGHIHFFVNHAEITGTGTIMAATTGGLITGAVDHIEETGAGIGAGTGILLAGTAEANIDIRDNLATTAYSVAAGATLRITANHIPLTSTRTGIAEVNGIVILPSGSAVPAASGYAEGQRIQLHEDDGGRIYSNTDVSGTKYWAGDDQALGAGALFTATGSTWAAYAPVFASGRKLLVVGLYGHTNLYLNATNVNYFIIQVQYLGADLLNFSTQNDTISTWIRHDNDIGVVIDLAGMDNLADVGAATEMLMLRVTEVLDQRIRLSLTLVVREVL